jgi:hypothetical protein
MTWDDAQQAHASSGFGLVSTEPSLRMTLERYQRRSTTVRSAISIGLTAGKEDHAEVGAAGATGLATRGSTSASTGTSSVKRGGDGATSCWSSSLGNKGTSTQGPQWSGREVHGVICCDSVEVGASGVAQRLFRAGSKAMCPSAPIHKTRPTALMGMSRQQVKKRAMVEARSPFIGDTRLYAGQSNSLQGRKEG